MAAKDRIEQIIIHFGEEFQKLGYEPLGEKTLESGGKWRKVKEVTYSALDQSGKQVADTRELLRDGDGSYVMALTPKDEVVFLLQLRPGLKTPFQVELPAGSVKEGEPPKINALNELNQEAGATVQKALVPLGVGPVLAGRSPQETYFYLARGVNIDPSRQQLDKGEVIKPELVPLELAMGMAIKLMQKEGNIGVDPKVLTAMVLGADYLRQNGNIELANKIYGN